MNHLVVTRLFLAGIFAGCGANDPVTSVEVALQYNDALQLETAEVTLLNRTQSANIAHQLLLLVPDELAGTEMPMEVWGRNAGKRAAYGTGSAVPVLGETVMASLTLTACSPGCQGAMPTTCTGPPVACGLGCFEDGDAHCIGPRPSNGIDATAADPLSGTTKISANATFDVDTGAITGGLIRDAVTGIDHGIGYFQAPAFAFGGAPLGIFVFHNLTIDAGATVQVTGTRAVVWLVGDAAKIAGIVDVAAGRGIRSAPGPGGGAGGTAAATAQGCGAGGSGRRGADANDSGGQAVAQAPRVLPVVREPACRSRSQQDDALRFEGLRTFAAARCASDCDWIPADQGELGTGCSGSRGSGSRDSRHAAVYCTDVRVVAAVT